MSCSNYEKLCIQVNKSEKVQIKIYYLEWTFFLTSLYITFRRDPTNFRPCVNKYNSVKDQEQKNQEIIFIWLINNFYRLLIKII